MKRGIEDIASGSVGWIRPIRWIISIGKTTIFRTRIEIIKDLSLKKRWFDSCSDINVCQLVKLNMVWYAKIYKNVY